MRLQNFIWVLSTFLLKQQCGMQTGKSNSRAQVRSVVSGRCSPLLTSGNRTGWQKSRLPVLGKSMHPIEDCVVHPILTQLQGGYRPRAAGW